MTTYESFKKEIKKIRVELNVQKKKIRNYEKKIEEECKKKEILQEKIEETCNNYLNYFEQTKDEKISTKEMIEKIMTETISPTNENINTNMFYEENGKEYIDKQKFIQMVKESLSLTT